MLTLNSILRTTGGVAVMAAAVWIGGRLAADEPSTPVRHDGPTRVALVDIPYLFEKLTRFNEQTSVLKTEVAQAEATLAITQGELQAKAKTAEGLSKTSPEYLALAKELTLAKAQLSNSAQQMKAEIVAKESKLYLSTYQEVSAQIDGYCDEHDIQLVVRVSRDTADESDAKSILTELNKMVVHYDPTIDITEQILARMEAAAPPLTAQKP